MAPRRVLVVEDDDGIAGVLVDLLADEGYDVRRAADGRAGLALLEAWPPDLVLLDLMMPVLDGQGFRRAQLGLGGRLAEIPVVLLTGAREGAARGEQLGAAASIVKPFELDVVTETVAALCPPPGASG